MPNDLDGFQFVSHKKKSRRAVQLTPTSENSAIEYTRFNKETCIRRIQEAKEDILATDFYESVKASLREGLQQLTGHEISEIVCFGLGRFTECMTSRYQFALLLLMRDLFTNRVSAYDPIFTNNERDVLKHFNINVIPENTEGKYKCGETNIFQCEKHGKTPYNKDKQVFNREKHCLIKNYEKTCFPENNNYHKDLTVLFPENCNLEHQCETHPTLIFSKTGEDYCSNEKNPKNKNDLILEEYSHQNYPILFFTEGITEEKCRSKQYTLIPKNIEKCDISHDCTKNNYKYENASTLHSFENRQNCKSSHKYEGSDSQRFFSETFITESIEENNCKNKTYPVENCKPSYDTTIFFLPHCPKQLSNNLLWANWGLDLSRCIIIGNSFNRILEANTKRVVSDNAEYLLKISPYVREFAIINSFRYYEIFNDTAIHIFPRNKLALVSEDFWDDNEEPVYNIDDVEFVKSTNMK